MMMSPGIRKFALTVHLISSLGWIGAVVGYLALGIASVTNSDIETMRSAWMAMELTGWWVIVPLAVASLLTGLVMSLGTRWGLFRHYWTLISLALTVLCTVVLVLHMPTVSAMASVARHANGDELRTLGGDLFHPGVGLLVLLAITVLNVYKPVGLTAYGWRVQLERRQAQRGGTAPVTPIPVVRINAGDSPGLSTLAAGVGSFTLHFAEMWFVMMLGMMLFVPLRFVLTSLGYTVLLNASSIEYQAWTWAFMVVPMVAWMRIRGCGWRLSGEMGAGMLLPVAAIVAFRGLVGSEALAWLANSEHVAMLVGMLAVMLYRRDHFTRGYSFIGRTAQSRRRSVGVRLSEIGQRASAARTR